MNHLIIFDGVCNLCTRTVQFIIRHETSPQLRFAPLQSTTGARVMRELGLDPDDAKTFVLLSGGQAFVKSDAAIVLATYLQGGWRALGWIRVVPRPIRDWVYGIVAKNRYRWFGRTETCELPSDDTRDRFIDDAA